MRQTLHFFQCGVNFHGGLSSVFVSTIALDSPKTELTTLLSTICQNNQKSLTLTRIIPMLRFHASSTTPKAKHEEDLSFSSFSGLSAHDIRYSPHHNHNGAGAPDAEHGSPRGPPNALSTHARAGAGASPAAAAASRCFKDDEAHPPPLVSSPGSTCSNDSSTNAMSIPGATRLDIDGEDTATLVHRKAKVGKCLSPKADTRVRECDPGHSVEDSSSSPNVKGDSGYYGANSVAAAGCGDGSNSPLSASIATELEVVEEEETISRADTSHNIDSTSSSVEAREEAIEESRMLLQDRLKREAVRKL